MAVRILRLIEYTYPDYETAFDDMSRWGVPATGVKSFGQADREIRSAVLNPTVLDIDIDNGPGGGERVG